MYWGDIVHISTTDISQFSSSWEELQIKKQPSSYMLEWIFKAYRKTSVFKCSSTTLGI